MRKVFVAGVGVTPFGKFAETSIRSMSEKALNAALADAAIGSDDVQAGYFANAASGLITGQEMVRGQAALRFTGMLGKPIVNVENACASGATAFHLGWLAVASGQYDAVVIVGAEKLTHPDKSVSLGVMGTAVDLEELVDIKRRLGFGEGEKKSIFMDIYAERARGYMERTGATREDLARIAVKSHKFGALNPIAQYREPVTVDQVLSSRAIADPITLLMCAPIADGAAAIVLTSESYGRSRGARMVEVAATVLLSGTGDAKPVPAATRAADAAYEMAGLAPSEIDVVEVHDATAPGELMLYESLRLCAPGEGPQLLRSGATDLGGRLPVNPSGGLLSRGHPLGATGCAQIAELTYHLRGDAGRRQREDARVGLAENGGGTIGTDSAAMSVTILKR